MRRVKTQREAAEFLDITKSRLHQMEKDSPWWRPELRTEEGYDVCGIVRAQLTYHDSAKGREEIQKRLAEAELMSAEAKAQADQLKAWQLEREKEQAQKNILPADVYAEFSRQLLGMIRSGLEELPEAIAEHVSPDVRHLFHVPEDRQQSERDASPLQKGIRKLIQSIEEWLKEDIEGETE